MARDNQAVPVQGPDTFPGNPLAIKTSAGDKADVNLIQVAGHAVVEAVAGVPIVGLADNIGNGIGSFEGTTLANALKVGTSGSTPKQAISSANAAVTLTVTGTVAQVIYLTYLSVYYTGAAATVTVTVKDGATQVWTAQTSVSNAALTTFPLPSDGLAMSAGNDLNITLPAGGAANTGVINAAYKKY
jgi:hypothetical protein